MGFRQTVDFLGHCKIVFGIFAYIKIHSKGPAFVEVLKESFLSSNSTEVVIYRKKIGVKYFNVPKRKRI